MDAKQDGYISLARVQLINWASLLCLTSCAWIFHSGVAAVSIMVGGVIANISFSRLQGDLLGLLNAPLEAVKVRFFIKYYLRLTVVTVLLYFLVKSGKVHTIGLLIGLSTVFLSIVFAVLSVMKRFFFSVKEAL